jgi:hypothetical protein
MLDLLEAKLTASVICHIRGTLSELATRREPLKRNGLDLLSQIRAESRKLLENTLLGIRPLGI